MENQTGTSKPNRLLSLVARTVIVFFVFMVSAMWIYAFVFASKESVNRVDDPEWATKSELICREAFEQRLKLIDLRQISDSGPDALQQRADIVDLATDTLEQAVNKIKLIPIADPKGRSIVPLWLADYTVLLSDRREYADELRAGNNVPFSESMTDGLPISEKISTFAADNQIKSCKVPMDLSI